MIVTLLIGLLALDLSDPAAARKLSSAQICRATKERAATVAELAKEKRLTREAGVVNLELLREYQNTLRDDDEEIASARQTLATIKLRPLSCSDRLVARIAVCLDLYMPRNEAAVDEACKDSKILPVLQLLKDPRDL